MQSPFHPGELELQQRAGVRQEAEAVGRGIGGRISAGAARFLQGQRLAVAASLEAGGRVWASLLTGPPGFAAAVDEETLRLAARPLAGDPLAGNLAARPELGLLLLDPRTRQRMRFNGRGLLAEEGLFLLVDQVYGNCPKYIQRRALGREASEAPPSEAPARVPQVSAGLSAGQQERLRKADTLFVASFHPAAGADASHRGGLPGFVHVSGPNELAFPDYPGNGMFNTLGNLLAYPRAGLLLVDFENGDVLQLSGAARVGADFSVRFEVESVRETPGASPLHFSLLELSPALRPPSHLPPGGI